jgi:hypothetical protein
MSDKIMIMRMFATLDKAKPITENISGLNLAAIKLTAIQDCCCSEGHQNRAYVINIQNAYLGN